MPRSRTLLVVAAGLLSSLAFGLWLARLQSPRPQPASANVATRDLPRPPALLPVRVATVEHPVQSWERLLAVDGTPREDLAALADLTSNYLQSVPPSRRPAVGFNEDLARVLTDRDALGDSALPATHPALVAGLLVDRWGTPWQVHPLSNDSIELRSAGPDRRLYSADDVAFPKPSPVSADEEPRP